MGNGQPTPNGAVTLTHSRGRARASTGTQKAKGRAKVASGVTNVIRKATLPGSVQTKVKEKEKGRAKDIHRVVTKEAERVAAGAREACTISAGAVILHPPTRRSLPGTCAWRLSAADPKRQLAIHT